MSSGIYKIENTKSHKIYVGSSKNIERRWKTHVYHLNLGNHINILLQRSWNKYGASFFKFEILELCNVDSLLDREQYYIDSLCTYGKNGYNRTALASGGDNLTHNPNRENIIKKIKNTLKLKYENMTKEEIKEIYGNRSNEKNANYGKRWTQEQRERASKRLIEFFKIHDNYIKGKTHIEYYGETKAKEISKKISTYAKSRTGEKNSFYGKKHTPETIQKISNNNKGNIPSNRKPFTIDGIYYTDLYAAQQQLKISYTVIQYRLNSKNPKFNNYQYCN